MKYLVILIIKIYQNTVGIILPPSCRYTPTCSNYFIEALKKRGLIIGTVLGIWRLLRCNPFGGSGYDPVPRQIISRPNLTSKEKSKEQIKKQKFGYTI